MTNYDNIVDVTEADFEYEVVLYSQQVPVLVDFWAEWCTPCRTLSPLLERLAQEYNGAFRLARVDVDSNPNLARRYNVRSIPTVKAFRNAQLVAEFTGVIPEPKLREFLAKLIPDEGSLELEKAFSLLDLRQPRSAEKIFRQLLDETPDQPDVLLGLAKSLLFQGFGIEASHILENFPLGKYLAAADLLRPLASALAGDPTDPDDDDPLAAAYRRSLLLVERNNIPAALDGLMDILREDKRYRRGEAHKVILGLFELLGENDPLTAAYRRELANVLF